MYFFGLIAYEANEVSIMNNTGTNKKVLFTNKKLYQIL